MHRLNEVQRAKLTLADNDLREDLHSDDRRKVLDAAAVVAKAEKEKARAAIHIQGEYELGPARGEGC